MDAEDWLKLHTSKNISLDYLIIINNWVRPSIVRHLLKPGIPRARAPRALTTARADSRQPHLHSELHAICGALRLAIVRAAASADGAGTGSRALACARLHSSRRATRDAHTGTRMQTARRCQRHRVGVTFTPCQQGRAAPWP